MQSKEFKSKNFDSRPKVLPIKKIVQETENIRTFIFDYSEFSYLGRSKPGQFVMLWIPGVDEKPFSIAYDDGKEAWLTIAKVGPATSALFKLGVGDLVGIRGPFGTHYEWSAGEHLALLAGGYGAAPLYGVARAAAEQGCKVEFIVGARSAGLLLYEKRIAELGPNVCYHAATDDGSKGHKGYNTEVLEEILAGVGGGSGLVGSSGAVSSSRGGKSCGGAMVQSARGGAVVQSARGGKSHDKVGVRGEGWASRPIDRIFACGPEMMMKKAAEIARMKGLKCQLALERYMKCGFGVCGQCCMDDSGVCVCRDGTIFDGEVALGFSEFGKYHRDSVGRKVEW